MLHRRPSGNTILTTTPLWIGNSRMPTHDRIKMSPSWWRLQDDLTRQISCKFVHGGFRANGGNKRNITYLFINTFFFSGTIGQTPHPILTLVAHRTLNHASTPYFLLRKRQMLEWTGFLKNHLTMMMLICKRALIVTTAAWTLYSK